MRDRPLANDGGNYVVGYSSGITNNDPGTTDVSADLVNPIVLQDAENLTLTSTRPVLGANWEFTTSGIDPVSPITVTFFSDLPVDPGLPLTTIGLPAPDCNGYIGNFLADATGINIGGSSTFSFPLPANPAFVGVQLAAQSICLTLQNPFNLLTSNGTLGN